ncbi:hypothetical protein [Haloarchaeobius sp. TZWSO28]|uniref:hypothetical protein n=1 Tax=Haloarchaeobius sp. TZWSO28 TaxID=3446119 RepID=UPI003EBEFDF7
MPRDDEALVQIIFQKDRTESIDFEIAFTALITTTSLTTITPESMHRGLITTSALLLLVLTMVRRMAVSGRFAPEQDVLSKTVRPIELFTVICVFQIAASSLSHVKIFSEFEWISGLVIFTAVLLLIVLQEFIFQNYRLWWGSVYYVKGMAASQGADEAGNPFQTIALEQLASFYLLVAYVILKGEGAIPSGESEYWAELRDFVSQADKATDTNSIPFRLMTVSGIVIILGYGLLSVALAQLGISMLVLLTILISIMAVRHIVGFWYLAYGSQTLSRSLQNNTHHLATMGVYGLTVYWLFFSPAGAFSGIVFTIPAIGSPMTLANIAGPIIGAVVGAGATIFGVRYAQSEQRDRWYSDYFLEHKISSLTELYSNLEDCHYTLNLYGDYPPADEEVYREEVSPRVEAYLRSLRRAEIYLDEETEEAMSEALGRFREMDNKIIDSVPDDKWDGNKPPTPYSDDIHVQFYEAHENAKEAMQEALNPETLRSIED